MDYAIYNVGEYLVVAFHYNELIQLSSEGEPKPITMFLSYHVPTGKTSSKKFNEHIFLSGSLRDMTSVLDFVGELELIENL